MRCQVGNPRDNCASSNFFLARFESRAALVRAIVSRGSGDLYRIKLQNSGPRASASLGLATASLARCQESLEWALVMGAALPGLVCGTAGLGSVGLVGPLLRRGSLRLCRGLGLLLALGRFVLSEATELVLPARAAVARIVAAEMVCWGIEQGCRSPLVGSLHSPRSSAGGSLLDTPRLAAPAVQATGRNRPVRTS
jgi:hypothetical protein